MVRIRVKFVKVIKHYVVNVISIGLYLTKAHEFNVLKLSVACLS